ncbi:MAG: 1-acyl-sn-glycerol-3-phosphate acyltransferase [Deltaproteobacteria bacterium]|nr:1-acyl-sn-glycerol-3-phosphate acyltransferase [Deltaproteobacteria bacterium]
MGGWFQSITSRLRTPRRSWMIERVIADPYLEKRLVEIAVDQQKTFGDLQLLATRYIREIAAHVDLAVIELISRVLTRLFRSLFDHIYIDAQKIEEWKKLSMTCPVIFVPNHRSHIDYLLLSHLLHQHQMTVPHVAAGRNLSFWPLGPIFRRGGAYFIRRTFRGNIVYRAVLETYLRHLLEIGVSQEIFIEGGRSRTGKLAPPKMGMITLLLEAAERGNIANVTFVPVAVGYDQVIEQRSYAAELRGTEKRDERPSDIIRLAKYLKGPKHRYGDVHVRFGIPLRADDVIGTLRERVGKIADHLCYEINRNIVVTPVAIAAAALLSYGRRGVTHAEVMRRARLYLSYLRQKGSKLADRLWENPDVAIEEGLGQLLRMHLILFHSDETSPYYAIPEDRRLDLDFVKNGAVHFFASIGMMASFLTTCDHEFTFETIVDRFRLFQKLFANEFRFSTHTPPDQRVRELLSYLESQGSITQQGGTHWRARAEGLETIQAYAGLVENFRESYDAALKAIEDLRGPQEERDVVTAMERTAGKMLLLGNIARPEAISRWNMKNAVESFVSLGVLRSSWLDITRRRRILTTNFTELQNLQAKLERTS